MTTLTAEPRRRRLLGLLGLAGAGLRRHALAGPAFDHSHDAWHQLLKQLVRVSADGHSSRVHYAGFQARQDALQTYLASLSAVTRTEYAAWTPPQQLAFLVNTYNAYTVALILTQYPDLKSIKDLGSVLRSPWKKPFFQLLGAQRSLDDLEHGLIRAPGVFNDPRIHVAVVCASVGCPMLRNEAYVAERLEAQLDDAMRRFLSDRSRNRYDAAGGLLAVSKVFDWYRNDFEQGHHGIASLRDLFARHASLLADGAAAQSDVRAGRYKLVYQDYDWSLNDVA